MSIISRIVGNLVVGVLAIIGTLTVVDWLDQRFPCSED